MCIWMDGMVDGVWNIGYRKSNEHITVTDSHSE